MILHHRQPTPVSTRAGRLGATESGRVSSRRRDAVAAAIRRLVVVVPARDEAANIGSCLRSVRAAAEGLDVDVVVLVSADSCSDGTEQAAREADTEVRIVAGRWGTAAAARHAGVAAYSFAGPSAPGSAERTATWVANTDADCVVPRSWLADQLALANEGVDVVAGIVTLDEGTCSPELARSFAATYQVRPRSHQHVHGANLGIRLSALDRVGGWDRSIELGEEHDLLARLRSSGCAVVSDPGLSVTTSARLASRVDGGFATTLAALAGGSLPPQLPAVHQRPAVRRVTVVPRNTVVHR